MTSFPSSFLLIAALLASSGCHFSVASTRSLDAAGDPIAADTFAQRKLWLKSWDHTRRVSYTTATASGPGGMAAGRAETFQRTEEVPTYIADLAREELPYDVVTPLPIRDFDYYLEGRGLRRSGLTWWTWLQGVVLFLPGWVLPTHGRESWYQVEVKLFDREHRLLRRWNLQYDQLGMEWFWNMPGGGGSIDEPTVVREAFAQIGQELRAAG
jgi:hypothetical protein